MNDNRAKKQRITDNILVVGANIAKETHVARAMNFRGIKLGKNGTFKSKRQWYDFGKLPESSFLMSSVPRSTHYLVGESPTKGGTKPPL